MWKQSVTGLRPTEVWNHMTECIALLRGINVGRAKRIAMAQLRALLKESWAPDALAIGPKAAYLWCDAGVLDSKLSQMFARRAGETVTTRNWATVLKLQAALDALP
jgi:uncharacterized protein (DUF1697 family)